MEMKECVIDASMGCMNGVFVFCPLEGETVVTGTNLVASVVPDGYDFVGVWHPDGVEAVKAFQAKYHEEINAMLAHDE